MSSSLTRRRTLFGAATLPLVTGVATLVLPEDALACHTYVSSVDGKAGCSAYRRDRSNPPTSSSSSSSTSTSQPQSSGSTSSSSSGGRMVYRDELVGYRQSRKSGSQSRLRISRAPDGRNAVEAIYSRGRSACAAMAWVDLFSGNGVNRAVFDVDLWISSNFGGVSGKLFGPYGGGDAFGGLIAGEPGCRNEEGGWAVRCTHNDENRVDLYSYHQNRSVRCSGSKKFGQTFNKKNRMILGRWVTFRQEVIMNSPYRSDGVVRLWMDGTKMYDRSGLMFQRRSDRYGIKGWSLFNMLGGSCRSSKFFPKQNQSVWYRDLRVST